MYKFCNNCGKYGHLFKHCRLPITSYGIIAFKHTNENNIEYILINRKHSISYIEFIRGKYIYVKNDKDFVNIRYTTYIFENMTQTERHNIRTKDFHYLWNDLWSFDDKKHKHEYITAKVKYNTLKNGINLKFKQISLEYILNTTTSKYTEPEWEFPKGRKNVKETDIDCALREFSEETDLNKNSVELISDYPVCETYIGSNKTTYRNIYYIAKFKNNDISELKVNDNNSLQKAEIGNIKWCNHKKALNLIRSYHNTKKDTLNIVNKYILNVYLNTKNINKTVLINKHKETDNYDIRLILKNINFI